MSVVFTICALLCLFCWWAYSIPAIRSVIIDHRMSLGRSRIDAERYCSFWRGFALASSLAYAAAGALL